MNKIKADDRDKRSIKHEGQKTETEQTILIFIK
jgi:hypothetical protein